MKAALIALAIVLVLTYSVAAAVVVSAELAALGVAGALIWRAARPQRLYRPRRAGS